MGNAPKSHNRTESKVISKGDDARKKNMVLIHEKVHEQREMKHVASVRL